MYVVRELPLRAQLLDDADEGKVRAATLRLEKQRSEDNAVDLRQRPQKRKPVTHRRQTFAK